MYDTLSYVQKLESVGIPRHQAEAQVEIMSNLVDQNFATTHDMSELSSNMSGEFKAVRSEMRELATQLRSEMQELATELRSEMQELKTELRSEMQELKTELRSEMQELKTELRSDMKVLRADLTRDMTIRLGAMIAASTTLTISVTAIMLSVLLRH